MINVITAAGWFLSLFFMTSLALPYNSVRIVCGPTYFYFPPPMWQSPDFFVCIGIFILVSILRSVFAPKLASVVHFAGR